MISGQVLKLILAAIEDAGGRGGPELDQEIHSALRRAPKPPQFATAFRRAFPYTSSKTSALRLFEILPIRTEEKTQKYRGGVTATQPAEAVFWWIDVSHEFPNLSRDDSIMVTLRGGPKGTDQGEISVRADKEALAIVYLILSAANALR